MENLILFASAFNNPLELEELDFGMRCIGIHQGTKKGKRYNDETFITGLRPLGFAKR